ncbi:MAG: tetratricopeptide repeat protein [Chloroflexi bacterium]|nr:tetratricopeptide repeat protein [Chloroflexota bacterium]
MQKVTADNKTSLKEKAFQLQQAGRWNLVSDFLSSIPTPTLESDFELRLLRAEADLRQGNHHQAVAIATALLAEGTEVAVPIRAKALLIRSAASRLRGFPAKALEDALTATAMLEGESAPVEMLIEAHKQVGIDIGMTGEMDQSIEHLEKALKLCAKSSDLGLQGGVENGLGIALARLGLYSEAQVHFNNARSAYQKLGSKVELSDVLNNTGQLHYLLGEYELAYNALQEALTLAREAKYHRTETMVLVNIGDTLQEMGDYEKALQSYVEAWQPFREALEPRLSCCINSGIGSVYCALQDFKKAGFYLKQATYEAKRLNLKHELAVATLNQGMLACLQRNYGKAEEELTNCIAWLRDLGSPRPLIKGYLYLALVYMRSKQWRKLTRVLETLARMVQNLDMTSFLIQEAKAVPEVIDYGASKRIEGQLFALVRRAIEGATEEVLQKRTPREGTLRETREYSRVEVYALGRMEVIVDGRKIGDSEWESQKAKEMFLYLLCHREGKRREFLLEVLWPEVALGLSRNAFYNNVYRVRRTLYKDCILLEDGVYKLGSRGEFWLDLEEFDRLTQEADRQVDNAEKKADLLAQAVRLYRGHCLEEFYSEWSDGIRTAAEARYLRTLATLASLKASMGDYGEAAGLLEKLLAIDDSDLQAYEQIIEYLTKGGHRGEARRWHQSYSELLKKEPQT